MSDDDMKKQYLVTFNEIEWCDTEKNSYSTNSNLESVGIKFTSDIGIDDGCGAMLRNGMVAIKAPSHINIDEFKNWSQNTYDVIMMGILESNGLSPTEYNEELNYKTIDEIFEDVNKNFTIGDIILNIESHISSNYDKVYLVHNTDTNYKEKRRFGCIGSWRGSYALPSLEVGNNNSTLDLLNELKAIEHTTYTGYKGGEFTYDNDMTLHYSEYGRCSDNTIIGVVVNDDEKALYLVYTELDY